MELRKKKIGKVLLKETPKHRWMMCWLARPGTQKYARKILPYTNYKDCEREAQKKNLELSARRGFTAGIEHEAQNQVHAVKDAVLDAVRSSNANPVSRADYLHRYNQFSDFLRERAPDVAYWHQVSPELICNYMEWSKGQGIKYDTIRLRLAVIRLTARHMARKYPMRYRNPMEGIILHRQKVGGSAIEDGDSVLSPAQFKALLKWLKANDPRVYVWSVLQGLCGLRLLEAAYLRERDFDPASKTITVTESAAHKPKTQNSYRRLVICDAAVKALNHWIKSMKEHHPDGFLFLPKKNRANDARRKSKEPALEAGCLGKSAITHACADALNEARSKGIDLPEGFFHRKLRATFVQAMRFCRVDFQDLQTYVGHAPQSVLSRHYDRASMERFSEIARMAQYLHDPTGPFKRAERKQKPAQNQDRVLTQA